MKLREIIDLLECPYCIEIKTENKLICVTISDSEGIDPYLDREVISWGLPNMSEGRSIAEIRFRIAPKNAESEPEPELWTNMRDS